MSNIKSTIPAYTGKIMDGLQNKIGNIAIGEIKESTPNNEPVITGMIRVNDVVYTIALWPYIPDKQ